MKYIILLFTLIDVQAAEINQQWLNFKEAYQKSYSPTEERTRFKIFQQNLDKINAHNKKYKDGETTWQMGITKFTDMCEQEFLQYVNKQSMNKTKTSSRKFVSDTRIPAATTIDWRTKNVVTPVKDEGQCGSSWAFSATGSLEAQNAIKTGSLVSLSEQQLVDCSWNYGNNGCSGGLMDSAFDYIKANGIVKESDYPYTALDGDCKTTANIVVNITDYINLPDADEDALQAAVQQIGPISVAIDAIELQHYESGILDENTCSVTDLNHGVLVVGYGEENGTKYWIVKNSWGINWGEQGYFRLSRAESNACGIATQASYPVL